MLTKQRLVDPQTEAVKADRDVEAEIRQIAAEKNLIKLKMIAEEKEKARCAREIEERREVRGAEQEEKEQEEAREIARYARLIEAREIARQEEKEREEKRHAREMKTKDMSVVFGKGHSVYFSLSQDQKMEHQEGKRSVRQVYQTTLEYDNEMFRSLRKDEKITFLDYAYKSPKSLGIIQLQRMRRPRSNQESMKGKMNVSLFTVTVYTTDRTNPNSVDTFKQHIYEDKAGDYPSLVPSFVTIRNMKNKVDAEEEGEEIEGAINLKGLFSAEEDSIDSAQEENSQVNLSEEDKRTKKNWTWNNGILEDLFSEEEDALNDMQEEYSKDMSQFCDTCRICQTAEKSNKCIKDAPLHPMEVRGEPFRK
ncbi:inner centromere protein-like [Palaemon carinicauda]|uniref:inner centromere protein-like n=1 Tax=Palaemon carinicauda TaxID=392227 RepID=UPI0035B66D5A